MLSKDMVTELNNQINAELYSAYLYMAMSSYASFTGLAGTANWFHVQAQEEMTHALRLYNHINDMGGHAILNTIAKPPSDFKSITVMFEESLQHEQLVTSLINKLVNLAVQQKDHASEVFLQWFVKEQVEEEKSVNDVLAKLKLAGDQGSAIFMIDNELAARTFVMPPDLAGPTPA